MVEIVKSITQDPAAVWAIILIFALLSIAFAKAMTRTK